MRVILIPLKGTHLKRLGLPGLSKLAAAESGTPSPGDLNPEPTDYESVTDPTKHAIFRQLTGLRECQSVSRCVRMTARFTDISTDVYRMTGMFAPIDVNTPAPTVTWDVNCKVAPFV
jgi:hypothetical protein